MAHLLTSYKGLTAFVTGGGSGLGAACVKRLIAKGCKVVCCDLKQPREGEIKQGEEFIFVKA
jgi:meso-butanediol dehydrogenase/(S,S)-butanediol dehydrogenase/diacetyl reductase